jgi:hypothetical protein
MNKKGIQLNQAFGAVLILVLIGALVVIGIYLVSSLNTSFPLESVTVINESGAINATGYTLANVSSCRAASPVIVAIVNATSGKVVAAANYSLSTTTWIITNLTGENYADAHITYTFDYGGTTCEAANTTITQFSGYPTLVGLVGTIIFLGIVIGVLVGSFAFGGKKGV